MAWLIVKEWLLEEDAERQETMRQLRAQYLAFQAALAARKAELLRRRDELLRRRAALLPPHPDMT
jgi:hypothetical protein